MFESIFKMASTIKSGLIILSIALLNSCAFYSNALSQDILPYEISSGIISYEDGNFHLAVTQLENAVARYPMRIEGYIYLSSANLGIEDYNAAIETAD